MARSLTVPTIFTAVDKFSGPLGKMSKKTSTAFAKMDRSMRKIEKTAFSTARKAAGVGIAIVAPLALLANEAVKFEASMSNVSTLIDTNVESIAKMGDEVLSLSKKLPVPIEELTAALYDVRSAGIAAEDAMATLEASSKLASGGLGTVQEATNITTSALNAFKSEGLSATEVTDILFKTVKAGKTTIGELSQAFGATAPIVQSAGVKLDDFAAATAALTTLGTPAAQAQNQIRASITALQKPSADMEKVFKKLGVTTDKELIQKFGGLVGGYEAVNGAIKELGLNQAKTFRSTEALAAVTSLTGATNEAYVETLASMRSGINELDTAFEKQSKTAKGTMQIAKNNFQALAITLGNVLIPMIGELMKVVTPMIERFATWAKNNKGTLKTILKVAVAVAGLAFAISGISFVIGIAAKAMMILNTIMAMNPIGLVVVAVIALGAALYAISGGFSDLTREQKLNNEVTNRALENTIDQRVELTILFKALRKAEAGSEDYSNALSKLEQVQPGITKQYGLQEKSLLALNRAEKESIGLIMDRAKEEARVEIAKEKIKKGIEVLEQEGSFSEALSAVSLTDILFQRTDKAVSKINAARQQKSSDLFADAESLLQQNEDLRSINPKQTAQEFLMQSIKESKESVTLDFINMPSWMKLSSSDGANLSMPGLGNTNGQ